MVVNKMEAETIDDKDWIYGQELPTELSTKTFKKGQREAQCEAYEFLNKEVFTKITPQDVNVLVDFELFGSLDGYIIEFFGNLKKVLEKGGSVRIISPIELVNIRENLEAYLKNDNFEVYKAKEIPEWSFVTLDDNHVLYAYRVKKNNNSSKINVEESREFALNANAPKVTGQFISYFENFLKGCNKVVYKNNKFIYVRKRIC